MGGFGLVTIAVEDYPDPPGLLPSGTSARRFADLLTGARGGELVDHVVAKNAAEVRDTLERWSLRNDRPLSTVVYLVGHGDTDLLEHWFLVPGAEARIQTRTLAEKLKQDWSRRRDDSASWMLLVLDCCASD